jgi:hypothetical protein
LPLFQPWIFVVIIASFDPARLTRTESQVQSNPTQILPYVAVNKDALPNSPADAAGCLKSFRLPKQAQVSRVSFQAQYQAFVRFAVGSSAALSAIALNWTCVLEPFTRGGLSL